MRKNLKPLTKAIDVSVVEGGNIFKWLADKNYTPIGVKHAGGDHGMATMTVDCRNDKCKKVMVVFTLSNATSVAIERAWR